MTTSLEKLQTLLQELFQLNQADLDFGIYRIMNHNRDEILRFLQEDLLPQVEAGFGDYERVSKESEEKELAKIIRQAQELLGFSREQAEQTPKALEIKERMQIQADLLQLEQSAYDHLYRFFRRYYREGDFLSLRRYTDGAYAIPYHGEEVKLHWANADQYYIKTAEHFQNYAFKLPSGRRVRFEVVAASTEQNNNKPVNGKERRFILSEAEPSVLEGEELVLQFEYRADEQKRKQDALNQVAYHLVMALPDLADWQAEFTIAVPTEKNPDRTLLQKYLTDFTARNTFDYFIHKNLGKFLRRELDFYIKSEVIHLGDIQHESPLRVKHLISKVRVLKDIGEKIICFLEQIETFQKKLWLKKKFVLETHYCVTLDRVPENLYPEIMANQAQIEEWKRLFAIDEIEEKVGDLFGSGTPPYSEPLTIEFLKANNKLLVDTQFFDEMFKYRLLDSIENFDEQCDGLLIHSENFQALNLLQERYKEMVKCIYIDPPYNTGNDNFVYKDKYQHSSWLSLITDRLRLGKVLQTNNGIIVVSIDDEEVQNLINILKIEYGENNKLANLIWDRNRKNDAKFFSIGHEYMLIFAYDKQLLDSQKIKFREPREGITEARTLFTKLRQKYDDNWQKIREEWLGFFSTLPLSDPRRRLVRFSKIDSERGPYRDDKDISWPGGGGPRYEILHPVTNKPCKKPISGWRYSTSERFWEEYEMGHIVFGSDETTVPSKVSYLFDSNKQVMPTVFYSYAQIASQEFDSLFGHRAFDNPKNWRDIARIIRYISDSESIVLDYFAGSGTTSHAVINLNREDAGSRKYILVEIGNYFDSVLKPRISKVIYSQEWKDGKPLSCEGLSHCFKYLRLESYEDALNNIKAPQRSEQQELALEQSSRFREEYMLTYKLDTDARGSASLLNPEAFIHPFNYQLKVTQNDDTRYVTVDLIETFNYLLGLTVQRLNLVGTLKTVQGINRQGDRVLVIWRDLDEVDNHTLDDWFQAQEYDRKDPGFDLIYVNGDNNLENLRPDAETWRVRLIDAEFRRLMFDVPEV